MNPRRSNDERMRAVTTPMSQVAAPEDRRAAYDDQYQYNQLDWQPSLQPPQAHGLMMHANRSVPTLAPYAPDHDDAPPLPQQPYDPTQLLNQFSAMHVNDAGVARAGSAMSYHTAQSGPPAYGYDPVQRAGTSMSMRSAYSANSVNPTSPASQAPRHANTLPTNPAQNRPPRSSSMNYRPDSTGGEGSSITGQIIAEEEDGGGEEEGLAYDTGPDTPADRASVYSQGSQHQQQQQQQQQQYHNGAYATSPATAQWQQQPGYDANYGYYQQQQYAGPQDAYYQNAPPGPPGQGGYPQQMGGPYQRSPYAQSVRSFSSAQSAPSIAPSMNMMTPYSQTEFRGQSDTASVMGGDDEEFARRPAMPREQTGVPNMRKANNKAVDLSAPPYTKQYVDEYKHRIKNDPDPEAHFAYAKYLVDASKKVGADAKDQRSVKKYREALLQEALKVIRRLATQGSPYDEAQFYLANCYGTGLLGLQVDHERAYHLYLQAAKQNNAAASYRVAVCNEIGAGTRKEPARAAAFYRKAASLGDTAAMYKLGMILLEGGLGEQKNPRDAIGWLKRAAEQADEANPHALHELALLHDTPNNPHVPYDPIYAKRLFTQSGQLGYTHSQFRLGQMYERGSPSTPQDPRRSIAWYTKAAEKGHAEAELALSGWYLTGVEGILKQSDSEAYLWARRAANKGLSKAEYAVGYYAEIGIGIKQDMEFAKRWYMRAAAQGNKRAMNRLTEIKLGGAKGKQGARPTRQQAQGDCVIA